MDMNEKVISVYRPLDVALARIAGGEIADRVRLCSVAKYCVITSISELGTNILFHAGSGTMRIRVIESKENRLGVEVLASDRGMGIANIPFALQDGFSTKGSLGSGLPAVSRLMSEMRISSTVGKGTLICAIKWADQNPRPLCNSPRAVTVSNEVDIW